MTLLANDVQRVFAEYWESLAYAILGRADLASENKRLIDRLGRMWVSPLRLFETAAGHPVLYLDYSLQYGELWVADFIPLTREAYRWRASRSTDDLGTDVTADSLLSVHPSMPLNTRRRYLVPVDAASLWNGMLVEEDPISAADALHLGRLAFEA